MVVALGGRVTIVVGGGLVVVVVLGGIVVGGVLIGRVVDVVGRGSVVVVWRISAYRAWWWSLADFDAWHGGRGRSAEWWCSSWERMLCGVCPDGMTTVRNPPEPMCVCSAGGGKPSTHPLSPLVGVFDASFRRGLRSGRSCGGAGVRQEVGWLCTDDGNAGARREIGNLGPRGAHVAKRHAGHAVKPDVDAGIGSVDHLAIANVDADMLDRLRTGSEEDQVTRVQRGSGRDVGASVELVLGHPGQADAGLGVDPLDEAGAVEANPRLFSAPDVRRTQVGLGVGDDHRTKSDSLS